MFKYAAYDSDYIHGPAAFEVDLKLTPYTRKFTAFSLIYSTPTNTTILFSLVKSDGNMWGFDGSNNLVRITSPTQGLDGATFTAGMLAQAYLAQYNLVVYMATTDVLVTPTFTSVTYTREKAAGSIYTISKTLSQGIEISLMSPTVTRFKNISGSTTEIHPIVHVLG
jgi:hypothetical protein